MSRMSADYTRMSRRRFGTNASLTSAGKCSPGLRSLPLGTDSLLARPAFDRTRCIVDLQADYRRKSAMAVAGSTVPATAASFAGPVAQSDQGLEGSQARAARRCSGCAPTFGRCLHRAFWSVGRCRRR